LRIVLVVCRDHSESFLWGLTPRISRGC
jgi:hypothetical protein